MGEEGEKRIIRSVPGPEGAGMRLDQYLAKRFTYHSRNAWQQSIRRGEILLEGKRTRAARILQGHEVIDFHFPEKEEPPVRKEYRVLAEHEHFIAVDKAGDLPVHPSGRYFHNTLLMLMRKEFGDLYIVNRLDRETSGVVLMARTPQAASSLSKAMMQRSIRKEYVVYVYGSFPEEAFSAKGFLSPDPEAFVRKKRRFTWDRPVCDTMINGEIPEECHTDFIRISQYEKWAKVRCILHTGRLHQIRATLCSLGYPVVGDKLYGPDDRIFARFSDGEMTEEDRKLLVIDRQALHAELLEMTSPFDGSLLTFRAPVTEELTALETL